MFEEEWRRESYVLGFLPVSAVPIARSRNRRLRYCAGYEDVYGGPVLIGVLSGHIETVKNNGYVLSILSLHDRSHPLPIPYNAPHHRCGINANNCIARSKERSEEEQVMVWLSVANKAQDEQVYNISSLYKHGV